VTREENDLRPPRPGLIPPLAKGAGVNGVVVKRLKKDKMSIKDEGKFPSPYGEV